MKMPHDEITDRERFPLLDESGRRMLNHISRNPHAPEFNHHCGEKLAEHGVRIEGARVLRFCKSPRSKGPRSAVERLRIKPGTLRYRMKKPGLQRP